MGNLFRCGGAPKDDGAYIRNFGYQPIWCKTSRDQAPVITDDYCISMVINDYEDFWAHSVLVVSSAIDLTNINTIEVNLKKLTSSNCYNFVIAVSKNLYSGNTDSSISLNVLLAYNKAITDAVLSADASTYTGTYYVYIGFRPSAGNEYTGNISALISDIKIK